MTIARYLTRLLPLLVLAATCLAASAQRSVSIAYFEPGQYFQHDRYYTAVKDELERLVSSNVELLYNPANHFTADWDPSKCRQMARQLADREDIDVIVAAGPWVLGYLLEADIRTPAVALFQPWQVTRNLDIWADSTLPFAYVSDSAKIDRDLTTLASLTRPRKIGILWFQSDSTDTVTLAEARRSGAEMGVEIVTSLGYTPRGLYAYFLAYNELPKDIDALYMGPLWGLDAEAVTELMRMASADRIPTFLAEDHMAISRGGFGTNIPPSIQPIAHLHAWQIQQIIEGARPSAVIRSVSPLPLTTINEQARISCAARLTEEQASQAITVFRTPEPGAEPFTVREAILRGLQAQPGLLAVEEQGNDNPGGSVWRGPEVTLSGSVSRVDQNAVHNSGGTLDKTITSARLGAYQPILDFNRRDGRRGTYELSAKTAVAEAKENLVEKIIAAYTQSVESDQKLAAIENLRTAMAGWLAASDVRRAIDSRTERDKRLWQSAWLDLTSEKAGLRAGSESSHAQLAYALGYPPETNYALDSATQSESHCLARAGQWYDLLAFDSLLQTHSARLTNYAFDHEPMHRSRERVGSWHAGGGTVSGWPSLGLFGALQYRDSLSNPAVRPEKHSSWELGAKLDWSLNGLAGRLFGRGQSTGAGLSGGFAQDDYRLHVAAQIKSLVTKIRGVSLQLRTLWRSREIGRESQRLMEQDYIAGTASALGLLGIARHTHEVASELISLQRSLVVFENKLALAAGLEPESLADNAGALILNILRSKP